MNTWKSKFNRRLIGPFLAVVMALSLGAYEFTKVAHAATPSPAPAAAALDDNSVSALLSLDHAMESLAARVTPAIVNVTVTSKSDLKANASDDDDSPQMQQFGLATYLLAAGDKAYFRYSNYESYYDAWWYPDYGSRLGAPLGPRYYNSDGAWQRDFACGSVRVDLAGYPGSRL